MLDVAAGEDECQPVTGTGDQEFAARHGNSADRLDVAQRDLDRLASEPARDRVRDEDEPETRQVQRSGDRAAALDAPGGTSPLWRLTGDDRYVAGKVHIGIVGHRVQSCAGRAAGPRETPADGSARIAVAERRHGLRDPVAADRIGLGADHVLEVPAAVGLR